jgi:hypothetical protein
MLSRAELEQLERFDGAGARVLSLYLNLAPRGRRPGHIGSSSRTS